MCPEHTLGVLWTLIGDNIDTVFPFLILHCSVIEIFWDREIESIHEYMPFVMNNYLIFRMNHDSFHVRFQLLHQSTLFAVCNCKDICNNLLPVYLSFSSSISFLLNLSRISLFLITFKPIRVFIYIIEIAQKNQRHQEQDLDSEVRKSYHRNTD